MTKRIKTLLFDFTGVLSSGKQFSQIYSEKFWVPIEKLRSFLKGMKDSAVVGKKDLKEMLVDVVDDWNWNGTIDELLDFWFSSDGVADNHVIELIKILKSCGYKIYLASNQEKYKANFIWKKNGFENLMDGKFISCELGILKQNPVFFEKVLLSLKQKPEEVLLVDDSEPKLEAAESVGINTYLFKDLDNFKRYLIKNSFI